ncbi:myosin F, putative [Plasmodium gallinaceum]|uniref:Myosin F, putative n=1 Tax=Plasmodium gallinaceum TaxID=5849 RepID=A0A1J1GVA3_PLAGA|nr:myosin F, putative [Plasmodium gallinaceum]CRG96455.1 myosin F, putative [Plasmodium gallinaceum]
MFKQRSLELRDINYIYENSLVWVNINSIKKKNIVLYREIFDYYKNKNKIFCFFKGRVKSFVSKNEVEIHIFIEDNYNSLKNNINYSITENVKYLLPMDTNFGCSDNTELIYLNPPNLLENIYQRYNKAYLNEENRNCIYTYIGYILLSVNPYETFEIYDENYMNKVKEENNLFAIPHPFSIANDAYNCLIKDKVSQSIIISGESGAGKTESSKQVLKYLTYLSFCHKEKKKNHEKNSNKIVGRNKNINKNNDVNKYNLSVKNDEYDEFNLSDINDDYSNNINKKKEKLNKFNNTNNNKNFLQKKIPSYEEKIQNSNPLLESFGNAKTIKNDNSSRFGKLMKLNYNEKGILCSASIETYLLAKSRVVDIPYGESNYHIFYSLCQNEKLKNEFNLLPWYKYNYLKAKNKISKLEEESEIENGDEIENEEEEEKEEKDNTENKKNKKNKIKKKKTEKERVESQNSKKNKMKSKLNCEENIDEQNKNYKCLYDLDVIIKCFHSIGVFENEQKEIYKTLICILLLGNIDFIENENEGGTLKIKNAEVCENLNKLLEIKNENSHVNKIVEILTIKKVRETQKNYTYQQAIYNRDVISKALYQLLFEYIISRVNDSLNTNEDEEYFENNNEYNFESEEQITNDEDFNEEKKKNENKKKRKRKSYRKKKDNSNSDYIQDGNNNFNDIKYFIGILDIYGFENFSQEGINGFEQLCINYANEILHSFFLKQIIYNEQKIHYEENLCIEKLHYNDNSNVISLIGDTKDVSIYTILEDLSLLISSNKSSEKNKNDLFFEKLNKNIINSAKYKCIVKNYKRSNNSFIISHYAGDVLYDSNDFFNKNVDILTNDIENFLLSCNSFISVNLLKRKRYETKKTKIKKELKVIELKIEETKSNKRKLSVKEMISNHESELKNICCNNTNNVYKNKVKSIFSYFKKQLEMLTNELDKTSSKFIRCIKPNQQKQSRFFNKNLVLNQLVMSGMVDILNLMKNGFPCRVLYDDIWISYSNILHDEMKEFLTPKMFCEIVLKFLEINTNEYTFGKTKVFFRFGVLSIINEILNKNEKKKNKFIECVYKFWLYKRKKRLLNFVLYGCRFKILFKKQRAKKLMEYGLNLYNNYLFKKKLHNIEKIILYYFNVYKQRIYFLNLRNSSLIIQKNFRKYISRKKYLYMKRQILFIQDYYLFQKYFKKRVNASNIIRKNWIMYITKSDYQYVLKNVVKIQRAFKKYMKKKYINYCLKVANINQQKKTNNILIKNVIKEEEKKNCFGSLNKQFSETDRVGSFIYIETKKYRHSIAIGEKLNNLSKSKNSFKKRKTWDTGENFLKHKYNTIHTFKYKHQINIKDENENGNIRSYITNGNDMLKNESRNSYIEDKPFISVGNIIKSEKSKIKGSTNLNSNNKNVNNTITKNKFRFSNLSICSGNSHNNLKNNNCRNNELKFHKTNKIQMKRKTYHANSKVDFVSSYKKEKKKVSNFIKNTIYDRYIDKYKQNHMIKQKEKKKKSIYIKSNYSNISNIYSVYKPAKTEKLKEHFNFDITDELIIPEDFYVCESYIPEPNIEHENNENYILLCNYLDNNLDSKIPSIELNVFKCNKR